MGLSPLLQKSLANFCKSLPKDSPLVVGKFLKPKHQLNKVISNNGLIEDPIKTSFIERVSLYILWRSILQKYVAPSIGMSRATYDLCKRCPPFGVNISTKSNVIPFESKYTCKHYMCPSCRMRKVLAVWNKFNKAISFDAGVPVDLVSLEVTRKFTFTGVSRLDCRLEDMKSILWKCRQLHWAYGGTWSLGIESSGRQVTVRGRLAIVCPPMPEGKRKLVDKFVSQVRLLGALTENDMDINFDRQSIEYDQIKVEKLFAKALSTAVWPASFMVNCTDPVSALFAAELESEVRGRKTIGSFGPCTTVRKRLQS